MQADSFSVPKGKSAADQQVFDQANKKCGDNRLSARMRKKVAILGFVGLLFCCSAPFLLSTIPYSLDARFPLGKNDIIKKADEFLAAYVGEGDSFFSRAYLAGHDAELVFVQRSFPYKKSQGLISSFPFYFWRVDYLKDEASLPYLLGGGKRSFELFLHPVSGKIIGFSRKEPSKRESVSFSVSEEDHHKIAEWFFSLIDFDISSFELENYTQEDGVYILEWKKILKDYSLPFKVRIKFLQDTLIDFSYFVDVPQKGLRAVRSGSIIDEILYSVLHLFIFGFGAFVFVVGIIRRKSIIWRQGFIYGWLFLLSFVVYFLMLQKQNSLFLSLHVAVLSFIAVFYFFWTVLVFGVSRSFNAMQKQDDNVVAPYRLILLAYIFVFTGLGVTLLFSGVILKFIQPVRMLGFYSFFSRFPDAWFSSLMPVFLSLSAAVGEELFFRALLISFFMRFSKNTGKPIFIAAAIWAFMHITPMNYSDISPVFLKGIFLMPIGILFGYIFVRFGLPCAIATHYLYDLVVIGTSYIDYSYDRYVSVTVLILLIAAIIPLFISLNQFLRIRQQKCG